MTDFDKTGLGIGGAGRHDLAAEQAELVARGTMQYVQAARREPMPNGQMWQPCKNWGCGDEPICLNCELCKKHCDC